LIKADKKANFLAHGLRSTDARAHEFALIHTSSVPIFQGL